MNIDQRLHHAARELHELPIAAPPLPGRSAGHPLLSKVPAVAASLLVVLGGVAVWSGLSTTPTTESDSEISSAVAVSTTPPDIQSAVTVQALGPREEIALIIARQSVAAFPAAACRRPLTPNHLCVGFYAPLTTKNPTQT